MKRIPHLKEQISAAVCTILISTMLLIQTNNAFSQIPDLTTSPIDNPGSVNNSFDCILPPGWDFTPTPTTCIISIAANAVVTINGIRINTCDYIGCFYRDDFGNLKCGGARAYNGNFSTGLIAFGDDQFTPEKEGFANGDTMHFKIFSWPCAGGRSIDVDSIDFETKTYQNTIIWPLKGISAISYLGCLTDFDCQIAASSPSNKNITLRFQKGWNAFNYSGNKPDLKTMISRLGKCLIVIKELKGIGIIWPEKRIYTFDDFIGGKDYMIKVTEDCTFAQ